MVPKHGTKIDKSYLYSVQSSNIFIMASINYLLRKKADKKVSIYIQLYLGKRKRKEDKIKLKTPTGLFIHPNDWKVNNKKSKLQIGFPKTSRDAIIKITRSRLTTLDSFIDSAINDAQAKEESININWLKKQIDAHWFEQGIDIQICDIPNEEKKSNLITDYIQFIIDNADTKVLQGGKIGLSVNRVKGYVAFKGMIEKFQKHLKKEIDLQDIDINFEEDFRNWLIKTNGYSINYAGKNFDNLKTVCKDAERMGRKVNPHAKHIKSFSENKDDREVITLSFDELDQIEKKEITNESLINVRKWLLIGVQIGQRGGDLLDLTEDNFRTDSNGIEFIDIKQQKTGKDVTIPVRPKVKQIKESGLPYKISIQKFNDYLKDLCKLCEIDDLIKGKVYDAKKKRKVTKLYAKYKLISSHICRRSFATNYYKKMPTPILMGITGHSKESLFLTYIGVEEDKDANAKLMLKYAEVMDQELREQKKKEKQSRKAKMNVIKKAN